VVVVLALLVWVLLLSDMLDLMDLQRNNLDL
jgi:hypothetical protein